MKSCRARKMETEDNSGIYVKVSMDGAPYLRKVDLRIYNGYKELRNALDDMMFISSCKRLRIMKGSEARGQ
ncbi:hypothetical protein BHM03_00041158 [Ensete ventricosum]|nr:hypothetical protein BHM03_00041158 [Ensete ventricosum]